MNALARLPLCPLTVTVTATAPILPAGVVAVIEVLLTTTTLVAAVLPNVTVAPAAKFVPVIVTLVLPAVEPVFGETLVIVGVATKVNALARLPLCPPEVTVTVVGPALPAGVVAVICVALTTTTFVAAVPPTVTAAPEAKPVPVIVMLVLPAVGPLLGETFVTVGGAIYVKPPAKLPFCPPEVTVTVAVPAVPAGVVAVIEVLLTTTTLVAAVLPNVTVAPEEKFVPVMVTAVPPAVGPLFGDTDVTVGAGPELPA